MEKNEALKQVESIIQAIEAGNKIFLSGSHMIIFGIFVFFIPAIEIATAYMSFGVKILKQPALSAIIHVLFYWVLFRTIHYFLLGKERHAKTTNPAIKKALTVSLPIVVSIFGSVIVLAAVGQGAMICPVVLLFLGILYNLIGQFSMRIVRIISWSYIAFGLIFIHLTKYDISVLWIIYTSYVGITYIIMGFSLKKDA